MTVDKQYGILNSKVQIPEFQKSLIIRERLLKSVDSCPEKMLILYGTMGYGKTVLMSHYIRLYEVPCAWYHLDEMDNDMKTFFAYLTAALKNVWADFEFKDENYQSFRQAAIDLTIRINTFLQRPENCGRGLVLVLDDFQVINNEDIFSVIVLMMQYSSDNLRIFLATKSCLPAFTAAFLLRATARVLQTDELAFNQSEVTSVLERITHQNISEPLAASVFRKVEGWPAGTMFVAQYMKQSGVPDGEPDWEIINDQALIQNYIMYELYKKLPYDIQQFLVKTSVLDEINVRLCNAALAISDARGILSYLLQENLFILRISKGAGSYRYHSMFKLFLQKYILPEQKREILDRAAQFYLQEGNTDRAIACYIQNGNVAAVEKLGSPSVPVVTEPEHTLIYIQYFGDFKVYLGEDRHEMSWRTKKAAELFACLGEREGKAINRSELLSLLWPEDYPNNAVAMLHNMLYNIRRELAPFGLEQLIQYKNKEYFMSMEHISSDLRRIKSACAAVEARNMDNIVRDETLFLTFWGNYLGGMENTWCSQKKYYYEKCYLDGCEMLGIYYMKQGNYKKSAEFLQAGLAVDTYSESMAVLLMQCYSGMQDRKSGKSFFERLRKTYKAELGVEPGADFAKAYEACINGQAGGIPDGLSDICI